MKRWVVSVVAISDYGLGSEVDHVIYEILAESEDQAKKQAVKKAKAKELSTKNGWKNHSAKAIETATTAKSRYAVAIEKVYQFFRSFSFCR